MPWVTATPSGSQGWGPLTARPCSLSESQPGQCLRASSPASHPQPRNEDPQESSTKEGHARASFISRHAAFPLWILKCPWVSPIELPTPCFLLTGTPHLSNITAKAELPRHKKFPNPGWELRPRPPEGPRISKAPGVLQNAWYLFLLKPRSVTKVRMGRGSLGGSHHLFQSSLSPKG